MNIETTIARMTTEEKVGQMFMLAFAGDQLDEARILMEEHLVGGAYISNDNVPTTGAALRLCNTLQSFAANTRLGIPLLLGCDQEGTWSVITAESAMGPGNMALGATGDRQCAYDMYGVIARETSAVGLNVVLGPAADCNSNPHNSIIGMRSFGEKTRAGRQYDGRVSTRFAGQWIGRHAEALPGPRRYQARQSPRLAHGDAYARRSDANRPAPFRRRH